MLVCHRRYIIEVAVQGKNAEEQYIRSNYSVKRAMVATYCSLQMAINALHCVVRSKKIQMHLKIE